MALAVDSRSAPHLNRVDGDVAIRCVSTTEEWTAVLAVRRRIFGDEQGIIDARVSDAEDRRSFQVVAVAPEGIVGIGRLSPPIWPSRDGQIAWLGVLPPYRGRGLGVAIMTTLLAAADAAEYPRVLLNAQTHALPFYRRFGFAPYGRSSRVRGVEHQAMARHRPG